MNAQATTSIATTAATPGVLRESRVSSLAFSATSQPQKKNTAITAPAAKLSGVNAAGEKLVRDRSAAICAPCFATAVTARPASTEISIAVIHACTVPVRRMPRTSISVIATIQQAATPVTCNWLPEYPGASSSSVAVAAGIVADTVNSTDVTSTTQPHRKPRSR